MPDEITVEITGIPDCISAANSDAVRRRILKIWAERMRAFWDRRFVRASRGDGTWAPLKPATVHRRRKGRSINPKKSEQVSIAKHFDKARILIDTGLLRGALNPKQVSPGAFEKVSVVGKNATLTLGFGGEAQHNAPSKKRKKKSGTKKSPITISQLAAIHHFGNVKRGLPARPLIVEPDEATRKRLEKIAEQELMKEV